MSLPLAEIIAKRFRAKRAQLTALPPPPAIIQQVTIPQVQQELVAAALVGEAGGEGEIGMKAVLNVIANRAGKDPRKLAHVVLQPYQFSFFNPALVQHKVSLAYLVAKAKTSPVWTKAIHLVAQASAGKLDDVTEGATFYHTLKVHPKWDKVMVPTAQIGQHQFYARPQAKT